MVAWWSGTQNTTGTPGSAPLTTAELLEILEKYAKPTNKYANEAISHIQKGVELEKGLRYIVSQTDLTDDNLKIRKNAMSELLEGEITAIQAELVAVTKIAEVIKESRYEQLLQQAGTQGEIEVNLFTSIQDMRVGDEVKGSTRKDLVKRVKQAESEYKKLANDLNTEVKKLNVLLGTLDTNLIESERAHVATLINMLTAHVAEATKIKKDLESNPTLDQVQLAKQSIQNMLTRYDARTELDALNEIRAENTEFENTLNGCFKETGAIEDLQKQVQAKTHEIRQIITELRANTNLIVF